MTSCRCRSPKISIRSVTSVRAGEHEPLRNSARPRTSGRDLHWLDTGAGQRRIERIGELSSPVADQEPEVRGAVTEVHQEVTDLLHSPRAVRVRGHAEDVHVAGVDFQYEQAVKAAEGHSESTK